MLLILIGIAMTHFVSSESSSSINMNEDKIKQGYDVVIYLGEGIFFNVINERHSLVLTKLENNRVETVLYSSPQKVSFFVGEEKKFNLNNDSYYDLSIKLNSIEKYGANFTIREIYEAIAVSGVSENSSITPDSGEDEEAIGNHLGIMGDHILIGLVILVLLIIVVALLILKKYRRKKILTKA